MEIGTCLRTARVRQGITLRQLANATKLSTSSSAATAGVGRTRLAIHDVLSTPRYGGLK